MRGDHSAILDERSTIEGTSPSGERISLPFARN
jgi:hypothetical protein